ncbi:acyl-CoA thioesterase [Spongiibacter sp. KMU-158]|uniref:Acyl-CoA thioesterase n=1 Tax=Spongiibacter pelagi TaxID=2760804 RepID=A0A927GXE1_9GAMM|nr:acyl-CoA thioesterase [Spongiibacter pelagi]MBD2859907.1 acyl-CoA thioesterase [Spongiibacter pelagi]
MPEPVIWQAHFSLFSGPLHTLGGSMLRDFTMYQLPYTRTCIQVRFSDLDPLNHVSNSVYAQYFDMARVDYARRVRQDGEYPWNVVASMKIDYLREICFEDEVVVDTWCSDVGRKSFTLQHRIFANNVCVTTCTVVLVRFDTETRISSPLPEGWQPTDPALIPA